MYGGLFTYLHIFSLDKNSVVAYKVDNVCVVPKPRLRDPFTMGSVRWTGRGLGCSLTGLWPSGLLVLCMPQPRQ